MQNVAAKIGQLWNFEGRSTSIDEKPTYQFRKPSLSPTSSNDEIKALKSQKSLSTSRQNFSQN